MTFMTTLAIIENIGMGIALLVLLAAFSSLILLSIVIISLIIREVFKKS